MVLRGAAAAARPAPSRHFAPSGEAEGVGTTPAAPPSLAPFAKPLLQGGPASRPHPRAGASSRSKAEAGGEAGAIVRGGRREDGGGYFCRWVCPSLRRVSETCCVQPGSGRRAGGWGGRARGSVAAAWPGRVSGRWPLRRVAGATRCPLASTRAGGGAGPDRGKEGGRWRRPRPGPARTLPGPLRRAGGRAANTMAPRGRDVFGSRPLQGAGCTQGAG